MNLSCSLERKKNFVNLKIILSLEEELSVPNLHIRVWKQYFTDGTSIQDPPIFLLSLDKIEIGKKSFTVKLSSKVLLNTSALEVGLVEEKIKWHLIERLEIS